MKQRYIIGEEDSLTIMGTIILVMNVPFTAQAPLRNWGAPFNEACEEAALVMASHYFSGTPFTAQQATDEILNVVRWERQIYGFDEDTSATTTAQTARDYFGLSARVSTDVTAERMKHHINDGKIVLVPVYGKALRNPHYRSGGPYYHMIAIIGYDGDYFITHDPGTQYGAQYRYHKDVVLPAIHDLTVPETNIVSGKPAMVVIEK